MVGDVAQFQKEAHYAVLDMSSVEFKQWCRSSLTKGAASAHAFLRKADEPPQIHVTFNDKRGDGSDPCTALSLRSDTWRKHWTKHDCDKRTGQLTAALKQARDDAVTFQETNGFSSFTAGQVTTALRGMKAERACGLDHWTPGHWLNLPIEARRGIASILSECEAGLVWPHQVMQNAVALFGASQLQTTDPSLSHHCSTPCMSKSRNIPSPILIVSMRLGGTLRLRGTLACVKVSGDGLFLRLPA